MTLKVKIIETSDMVCFTGDIYSQWYNASMVINGKTFNSCEQWMMYSKARLFNDDYAADKIMGTDDPKEQKKYGRLIKNFNDNKWLEVCDDIVYNGNYAKFSQNEDLKKKLLATGNKIIAEGADYDARWGTGLNIEDTINTQMELWGENRLGKALMAVRKTLRLEEL